MSIETCKNCGCFVFDAECKKCVKYGTDRTEEKVTGETPIQEETDHIGDVNGMVQEHKPESEENNLHEDIMAIRVKLLSMFGDKSEPIDQMLYELDLKHDTTKNQSDQLQ